MLKKNDEDLREFRAKLPKQVRDLLPRDLAGMEDDTRKMQAVTARLNVEADLLLAADRLRYQQGETVDASELREELTRERRQREAIETMSREKDEEIMRLRSIPAQVVHS
jgi:hypothetical protein